MLQCAKITFAAKKKIAWLQYLGCCLDVNLSGESMALKSFRKIKSVFWRISQISQENTDVFLWALQRKKIVEKRKDTSYSY